MQKLIIIGNLTANPESRFVDTATGSQNVCNFTVATNRIIRGNKTAEYFRVSLWNKQADNAMKYLSKGSKVCVIGTVTARAYTAQDGTLRASLEVQGVEVEYLSSSGNTGNADGQPPQQQYVQNQPQASYQQPQQQYQQNMYTQNQWQNAPAQTQAPTNEASQDGFMNVPPGINDEGLPFS